jgi:antibiotic biosynthesis monooxygenase (ABM) superfamily enzyme
MAETVRGRKEKDSMNSSPAQTPHCLMENRGTRASTVILHRVPPERATEFTEWERGITEAAEGFAGYQATEIYPPADRRQQDWVVVMHFDNAESLQRWVDSPERHAWTAKLPAGIGDFRIKSLPGGFGSWFAGLMDAAPAPWKMALTVVLGLYPTVMVLNILLGRYLSPLGLAVSMLIGNALSVSILQWGVMPLLETALRPWFKADAATGRTHLIGGLILILLLLAGMAVVFRQITG